VSQTRSSSEPDAPRHGWCSLRIRFDEREQALLKGAEQIRGAAYAATPRPDVLRTALNLARAGHKVAQAHAGASISLDEPELRLILDAVRFSTDEVRWASRQPEDDRSPRRATVLQAYPELVERGAWRGFGLGRELEELSARLATALNS
jgi:hypothetical protein